MQMHLLPRKNYIRNENWRDYNYVHDECCGHNDHDFLVATIHIFSGETWLEM